MTLPDVPTLNRLCREQAAIGQCADGNCDGCVIVRAMMSAPEIRRYVRNVIHDLLHGDPDDVNADMIYCMAAGFIIGREFEREQRSRTQ